MGCRSPPLNKEPLNLQSLVSYKYTFLVSGVPVNPSVKLGHVVSPRGVWFLTCDLIQSLPQWSCIQDLFTRAKYLFLQNLQNNFPSLSLLPSVRFDRRQVTGTRIVWRGMGDGLMQPHTRAVNISPISLIKHASKKTHKLSRSVSMGWLMPCYIYLFIKCKCPWAALFS